MTIVPNLFIMPASEDLAAAEREKILPKRLESAGYD